MKDAVRKILHFIGENPKREGLLETPQRFSDAMVFLTRGYKADPAKILASAIFRDDYKEMVVVRDIEFYSLCEHHLLPFFGRVHVGFLPHGRVVGFSEVVNMIEAFSQRLQVQERFSEEIADALQKHLKPFGVGVVVEASHFCTMMRGIGTQSTRNLTSVMRGCFLDEAKPREEFLRLIGK